MNIYLMVMCNLWLHITHIPSVLINFFISWPHINLISSHLITVFFSNYLWFRLCLFIIWCGYSNWDWYLLIILSFIFISFFIWVEMYMNIIRMIKLIFLIVSIMIWPTTTWEIPSRVIIWSSVYIKIIIIIFIWVIIWHDLIMMCFFWLFLIWLIFCNILPVNIRNINNILTMFGNRLIVHFIRVIFNIKWIFIIRVNKFTILSKNIIPIILILKPLSKHIINCSWIYRVTV